MKRKTGNKITVLFLTIVMIICSLSVVPVTATTPTIDATTGEIVIAATDYNTKEGTVEKHDTYLLFNPDGSVTYNFTLTEEGTYKVKTQHQKYDSTDTEFEMTIKIDDQEEVKIQRRADYNAFIRGAYSFELGAGEHTMSISITSQSGGMKVVLYNIYLEHMKATELSGNDENVIRSVNYAYGNFRYWDEAPNTGSDDQGVIWNEGAVLASLSDQSIAGIETFGTYYVKVEEDSYFDLALLIGSDNNSNVAVVCDEGTEKEVELGDNLIVPSTGAYGTAAWASLGKIRLTPGEHKIKISLKSGVFYLFALKLKLVGGSLKLNKVEYGDGISLSDGATIPRGTDVFKLYFNVPIMESTLTTDNIWLVNSSDEKVALVIEKDDTTAAVKLKDTLIDGETYTLYVKDISPEYGSALSGVKEYTFTADETGEGGGTIECMDSSATYGNINIKFVVRSSVGETIKGRKVTVTRTAPAGGETVTVIENVLSDANGIVTVDDIISGTNYGNYTYTATCEYGDESASVALNYVTKEYEAILLGYLKETTSDTIGDFFTEYSEELGINPAEDIPDGVDESKVYEYFIGMTIVKADDFREKYHTAVYTETINQASEAGAVAAVLKDEKAVTIFGLDSAKLDVVLTKIEDDFSAEILNLDTISDLDQMKKTLGDLLNHTFMELCGKKDVVLKSKSITTYKGKTFEIPLEITNEISEVTNITINVVSGDMTVDEDMTVIEVPTGAKATYEWNDDVLTIEIDFNKRLVVDHLGKIFITGMEDRGAYTVKVSGNIVYDVNLDKNPNFDVEEDIPVIGNITEATFPVTVAATESSSKKDSVSTIDYGSYTKPTPVTPPAENQDEDEKFEFDDISDVEWATESINALLEKGIISKSDNKKFNPNDAITRAEYLKLVIEALGMADETAESDLTDVSKEDWFYKYVASAQSAGIVFGNGNGEFNPNASITREDMAVIAIRAMDKAGIEIKAAADEKFSDDESMSDYAKTSIYSLKGMGIINGVGDNRFNPLGNATRAETAKMIYELIKAVK